MLRFLTPSHTVSAPITGRSTVTRRPWYPGHQCVSAVTRGCCVHCHRWWSPLTHCNSFAQYSHMSALVLPVSLVYSICSCSRVSKSWRIRRWSRLTGSGRKINMKDAGWTRLNYWEQFESEWETSHIPADAQLSPPVHVTSVVSLHLLQLILVFSGLINTSLSHHDKDSLEARALALACTAEF